MKIFNSETAKELAFKYKLSAKDISTIGNRDINKITINNVKEHIKKINSNKIELKKIKETKESKEFKKTKLIDCIIKHKYKKCSIDNTYDLPQLPLNIFNYITIKGDGACQLRSIAYNILLHKNIHISNKNEKIIANKMYIFIKYIITEVLPNLTFDQITNQWGFIHFDSDISVLDNLNNDINFYHNESEIYSLQDYVKKFKYGVYTTQLELFILMNNNILVQKWWIENYDLIPAIIIYIVDKKKLIEIGSFNIDKLDNKSVPIFRLLYKSKIHYDVILLKEECKNIKDKLRENTIIKFYS